MSQAVPAAGLALTVLSVGIVATRRQLLLVRCCSLRSIDRRRSPPTAEGGGGCCQLRARSCCGRRRSFVPLQSMTKSGWPEAVGRWTLHGHVISKVAAERYE